MFTTLAEIVFFVAFFVAWVTKEIAHAPWIDAAAIASLVVAALLAVELLNLPAWPRSPRTPGPAV